jgi:hypothetical protein
LNDSVHRSAPGCRRLSLHRYQDVDLAHTGARIEPIGVALGRQNLDSAPRRVLCCAPGQSGSGAALDAGTALCAVFITIARKV